MYIFLSKPKNIQQIMLECWGGLIWLWGIRVNFNSSKCALLVIIFLGEYDTI